MHLRDAPTAMKLDFTSSQILYLVFTGILIKALFLMWLFIHLSQV